jgi:cell division protein FtsW (lipid II flippase)
MAKPRRGAPSARNASVWAQRTPERQLLLSALLITALGYLMLLGARPKDGINVGLVDWAPLLVFVLAFAATHAALVLARFRGDQLLIPLTALLSAAGLWLQVRMGLFGTTTAQPTKLLLLPGALAVMLSVALIGRGGRYRLVGRFPWLWALISLAILAFLLATGQRFRGAVYGVGFLTPTELLKLTMVLFSAAFVNQHLKRLSHWGGVLPPLRQLWALLLVWALVISMLLWQRDLGLIVILGITLLALLTAGTRHPGYPLYGLTLAVAAGAALAQLFLHGQRRIQTLLDPFSDPTGSGWQVLQGLSGMYAGGLWGEGFSEPRPRYAPIAESDFIYSVLAEELGFIGSLLLVVLFVLWLARLLTLAARARTPLGIMLATGIASVLTLQTLMNIGGVTKALPLTGITLPLISHGGSSLMTVFVSLGLVLAISDGEPPRTRKAEAAKSGTQRATTRGIKKGERPKTGRG